MYKSIIIATSLIFVVGLGAIILYRSQPKAFYSRPMIPAEFSDTSTFLSPIKNTNKIAVNSHITGLIVPHHLLAANMIADAFTIASHNKYDRIIILSPDHYFLGSTSISIAPTGFKTVFGDLLADNDTLSALSKVPNVSSGSFFYREHGIGAELPFIKYFFPNAKIVAIAIKENTPKQDLDPLVDMLKSSIDQNTLIIQSTDFSHYLESPVAAKNDIVSKRIIEENIPNEVFSLKQPANIDSTAALYVQMKIQKEFFKSTMSVIGHGNSQDYTNDHVDKTTSYFTIMYTNYQFAESAILQ